MNQLYNFTISESSSESSISASPDLNFEKNKIYQINAQLTVHVTVDEQVLTAYYTIKTMCKNSNFIGNPAEGYRLETIVSDKNFPLSESQIRCYMNDNKLYIKCIELEGYVTQLLCNIGITEY